MKIPSNLVFWRDESTFAFKLDSQHDTFYGVTMTETRNQPSVPEPSERRILAVSADGKSLLKNIYYALPEPDSGKLGHYEYEDGESLSTLEIAALAALGAID